MPRPGPRNGLRPSAPFSLQTLWEWPGLSGLGTVNYLLPGPNLRADGWRRGLVRGKAHGATCQC